MRAGNYSLVTSNTGFDSGKVSWKIKANSTPDANSFLGVATVNRPGVWETGYSDKRLGTVFFFDSYPGHGCDYGFKDGSPFNGKGQSSLKKGLSSGKTLTILLDCVEAKISYWIGGEKKHSRDIERGRTYYPMMLLTCFSTSLDLSLAGQ